MFKWAVICLSSILLLGCHESGGRMSHAEDPQGRYHEQIAVAKRVLEQNENWADRAEWEVEKNDDGWKITAWRIEHPENKGAARYVPWGRSIIEVDHRMIAIHYQRKG